MKVLCVYNPKAGGGKSVRYLEKIKKLFIAYSIEAEFVFTEYPRHATEIVKNADLSLYSGLVVAGGDGSFFDVLNGYMENPGRLNTPLGILPVGTGNSLSRDVLDEKNSLEDFVSLIAKGDTKSFDIAKVQSEKKKFYFANMMGFGFITDVSATASKIKFFKKMAYTFGVLYNTIKLNAFDLKMTVDDHKFDLNNVFVIVSNSKYTAGNYLIAPKAKIDDGMLDLIIVNKLRRRDLLKTFPKTFNGSHINTKFVDYRQAKHIKFDTEKAKILSPDGEVYGELPVDISCIPAAVNIFAK